MGRLEELKDIVTLSREANITLPEAITLYKDYKKASSDDSAQATENMEPEKTEEQSDGKEQPNKALNNELQTDSNDNVIDYKSKYEEMEKKLQKLQEDNAARDISNNFNTKSDEDLLNEITQFYM